MDLSLTSKNLEAFRRLEAKKQECKDIIANYKPAISDTIAIENFLPEEKKQFNTYLDEYSQVKKKLELDLIKDNKRHEMNFHVNERVDESNI